MNKSFIFGHGTGKTYADMTRAREIAKALTDGMPQAPQNVGEGLNAIGSALMARAQTKRADKMRDDLAGQMTPDHPLFAKLYGLPAYRNGTNFHPGGMAVVGEDGPEVVQLPRGAAVIPNPMTMAYRPGVDQANVYQGPATAGMAQVMQAQADPDPTAKSNMFFVDPEGTVPPQLLERFKQLPLDMQRSIVDEIMKGAPAQELIPPARKSSIAPDPAAVMASINPQPVKPQSRMMDAQAVQVADASGQPDYFNAPDIGVIDTGQGGRTEAAKIKFALQSMFDSLDDYENIFREGGGAVKPSVQRDKLVTQRRAIQMQMKDLYNLGALQGPDLALLEGLMVDPTGFGENAMDFIGMADLEDRFFANTNQIRDIMLDLASPRLREFGIDAREIARLRRPVEQMDDAEFLKSLGLE